jgi:hypothetical protein
MPGPAGGAEAGGAGALTAGYEREGEIETAGIVKTPPILSIENDELPLKAEKTIRNVFGKDIEKKRDRSTAASIDMPDLEGMVSNKRSQDSMNMPFGEHEIFSFATESRVKKSLVEELYGESPFPRPKMTAQLGSALKDASSRIRKENNDVLLESQDTSKTDSADE